ERFWGLEFHADHAGRSTAILNIDFEGGEVPTFFHVMVNPFARAYIGFVSFLIQPSLDFSFCTAAHHVSDKSGDLNALDLHRTPCLGGRFTVPWNGLKRSGKGKDFRINFAELRLGWGGGNESKVVACRRKSCVADKEFSLCTRIVDDH